jgi:hypothetical protein
MNGEQQQFEGVLVDVRKAYRLLHDYQRLILDAMKYIASQLGLAYDGGFPRFSGRTPGGNNTDLDLWAWDWLNMLWWEFHFSSRPKEGHPYLSICLLSDTGRFESENDHVDIQKTDTFHNITASKSKLLFKATNRFEEWDWNFPDYRDDAILRQLTSGNPAIYHKEKQVFTACCDVSCLCNSESVDATLKDFVEKAQNYVAMSLKGDIF